MRELLQIEIQREMVRKFKTHRFSPIAGNAGELIGPGRYRSKGIVGPDWIGPDLNRVAISLA